MSVNFFQFFIHVSFACKLYIILHHDISLYFPGEFGSERLVQKVVDKIFRLTETKTEYVPEAATSSVASTGRVEKSTQKTTQKATQKADNDKEDFWKSDEASKIILTGFKVSDNYQSCCVYINNNNNI